MTALTPREIMLKQSDGSVAKAEGSIGKLFLLAMMAGAFIALGAQASLMASFNLTSDPTTFGIGKVVKLEGVGENLKATVVFRNTGTKQLLVKFAKFTVIDH